MRERINVTRSSMPPFEEFVTELKPVWESRWLSNRGAASVKFENMLKEYLNTENLYLFANGHVALEVALNALNLKGEVITTPYTHCSTTHSIVRNGLTPVFCDVKEDNYTINPEMIEDFITESYILEVSSPGLGRPLKKEKDFARSLGKDVDVKLYRARDKRKDFTGVLKAYDEQTVTIEEEGEELVFERGEIALIRLAFDF